MFSLPWPETSPLKRRTYSLADLSLGQTLIARVRRSPRSPTASVFHNIWQCSFRRPFLLRSKTNRAFDWCFSIAKVSASGGLALLLLHQRFDVPLLSRKRLAHKNRTYPQVGAHTKEIQSLRGPVTVCIRLSSDPSVEENTLNCPSGQRLKKKMLHNVRGIYSRASLHIWTLNVTRKRYLRNMDHNLWHSA